MSEVIYFVEENIDKCEGRGPYRIIKNSGYFTDLNEAWAFADTIPGVMRSAPPGGWRTQQYPDVRVITLKPHNSIYFKKKEELETEIKEAKRKLRELEGELNVLS